MIKKKISKRQPTVKHRVGVHRRSVESPRSKVERMLGKKLLKGEIPVVRPGDMPSCPVPSTHVRAFNDCCRDFATGKTNEAEAMSRVTDILRSIRKPEPETPKSSGETKVEGV